MQLGALRIGAAELRDLLAARDRLLLLHHDVAVVPVYGDIAVVVLDHYQLAHAGDARADVGDTAGRRRDDGIAGLAVDVDALPARLGELGEDLAFGGPDEEAAARGRGRRYGC